ncbi:hypothetical protein S245_050003 [Arachis hypogaea]
MILNFSLPIFVKRYHRAVFLYCFIPIPPNSYRGCTNNNPYKRFFSPPPNN